MEIQSIFLLQKGVRKDYRWNYAHRQMYRAKRRKSRGAINSLNDISLDFPRNAYQLFSGTIQTFKCVVTPEKSQQNYYSKIHHRSRNSSKKSPRRITVIGITITTPRGIIRSPAPWRVRCTPIKVAAGGGRWEGSAGVKKKPPQASDKKSRS